MFRNDYNPVADPAGSDEPLSVTRARLQKAREEAWKRNAMVTHNLIFRFLPGHK